MDFGPFFHAEHFKLHYILKFIHVDFALPFRPLVFGRVQIWRLICWNVDLHFFNDSLFIWKYIWLILFKALSMAKYFNSRRDNQVLGRNILVASRIHDTSIFTRAPKPPPTKHNDPPRYLTGALACMKSPFCQQTCWWCASPKKINKSSNQDTECQL